jgi:hypothetical protein
VYITYYHNYNNKQKMIVKDLIIICVVGLLFYWCIIELEMYSFEILSESCRRSCEWDIGCVSYNIKKESGTFSCSIEQDKQSKIVPLETQIKMEETLQETLKNVEKMNQELKTAIKAALDRAGNKDGIRTIERMIDESDVRSRIVLTPMGEFTIMAKPERLEYTIHNLGVVPSQNCQDNKKCNPTE